VLLEWALGELLKAGSTERLVRGRISVPRLEREAGGCGIHDDMTIKAP